MDYKYLKAFVLTAQHQSFSKAAEELRIAQSAVSRQIKLLEESVGQQLIIRSSKKMVLTPQGQELFQTARDFDRSIQSLLSSTQKREVRIGVLHGVLETWLVGFLAKRGGGTNYTIRVAKPPELIQGLLSRELDLVLGIDDIQNEMISSLKLFDEEMVLISKKKVDLKQIHQYRWISYDYPDRLHHFFKKKQSPDFIHVNSMTAIVSLVRADLGIAIVPTHILRPEDKVVVTRVPGLEQPSIFLSTLNYAVLPKHLKPIVEALRETAKTKS